MEIRSLFGARKGAWIVIVNRDNAQRKNIR